MYIRFFYCVFRLEETKLVCAISRKLTFYWKTYFCCIGCPKMDLKWTPNDPKMIPKCSQMVPPQSPSPAKASCQEAKFLRKNTCLMICNGVYEKRKRQKSPPNHRCIIKKQINNYIGCWMEQILVPIAPPHPHPHPRRQ